MAGMSEDAENSTVAAHTIGRPFARGASGNPGGRSRTARDIQTLAQRHGPEAIETLAQALKSRNERVRVAAAAILLDRAYGKPAQAITTDPATNAVGLHLVSAQLIQRQSEPRPQTFQQERPQMQRLLDSPPPLEYPRKRQPVPQGGEQHAGHHDAQHDDQPAHAR
jgi:hypothetical protein